MRRRCEEIPGNRVHAYAVGPIQIKLDTLFALCPIVTEALRVPDRKAWQRIASLLVYVNPGW